jgi:hypothetical protein
MFALVVRDLRPGRTDPRPPIIRPGLLVLTVFTTLLQPATTLALAPATVLLLLITRRLRDRRARAVLTSFVLPGALVSVAEAVFLASDVSPYEQATWLWRPFWVWHYFGLDRPAAWMLVLLFAICAVGGGRRYLGDRSVQLAGLAVLVGAVPFLLLEQTTVATIPDGDLGVPPMMALILLFLVSLRFIALEAQAALGARRDPASARPVPRWLLVAGAMLAVMLVAGVVDLAVSTGVLHEAGA